MNYAENNVYCVNQYQIPGALKLPLEATMLFDFFSIKFRKKSNFFFISWFCNLSQTSSETSEICIHLVLCLPYPFTMHFLIFQNIHVKYLYIGKGYLFWPKKKK